MQDDRPECAECGATVPYTPTPDYAFSSTINREPTKFFCDEKCMVTHLKELVKDTKDENPNESNAVRSSEED